MFVFTVHTALGLPGNSDTAISLTYTKGTLHTLADNECVKTANLKAMP